MARSGFFHRGGQQLIGRARKAPPAWGIDGERSRFDDGARSSARVSDATDDDLCLFVTPDENRPGSAAIKRPGCPTSDMARIVIPAERRDLSTITHLFALYCLRDA